MLAPLVPAVLAAQPPAQDSTALSAAYLDADARRLVAGARVRRETIDRSISAYRTTMRERIGVGIRALRRDRMLYRRELVLRIDWRRDSLGRIEVIGARQTIPVAVPFPTVPEDLKADAADYAFDPADDRLTVGFGRQEKVDSTEKDRRMQFLHPLAPNSERNYRFASGDSSAVVFSDGRIIRLRELRVIPRRLDFRLMSGSFWIDEESHAVVRALIRPARPFDYEQDTDEKNDDIPGFIKPIRVEVRFLTIDYGLWAGRWWLPRLIAMDAVATAGSFLQTPVRYERLYSEYEVEGDTTVRRAPRIPVADTGGTPDSAARARCKEQGKDVVCRCRGGTCRGFVLAIPTDSATLLTSTELPPPFSGPAGSGDSLMSRGEMEEVSRALGRLPAPPWQFKARPQRFSIRLYAEQQRRALKRTDFSLPHAVHEDHVFRPNIVADSADQIGAAVTFRAQRGIDPEHTQWLADLTLDGGAGTYGFSRSSGTLRFTTPLGGRRGFAGAVELGGGMSAGRVPVQSFWYLGGPGTLRGYGGAATSGDAFWRARLELANRWPAARLVLFGDVARAGPREQLSLAHSLMGLGIGASFVDGLVRIDVTRAVRSPTGWRVDFYTDAAL